MFSHVLTILLLLVCNGRATTHIAPFSPKRGFVADGCMGPTCTDVELLNPGWYYDYNPQDRFANEDNSGGYPALFTPMHWCISNATLPAAVNHSFLLGYNEPNNEHNCNKSPREVAQSWAGIMSRWSPPSTQLISPATAGDGIPWLDAFFGNCSELYGSQGCKVFYVAVHDYSCKPQETMDYLKKVYHRYQKPVWLTEFSCGDGAANKPLEDHLEYMKAVLPLLDAAPYVFRYAWMSIKSPNRGLILNNGPNQTLSPVGHYYSQKRN